MKKYILCPIIAVLCCLAVSANANVTTCSYTTTQLGVLDHAKTYTWGIDLCQNPAFAPGCDIKGATLTFTGIRNIDDSTNILYIHLVNTEPLGVTVKSDGGNGDKFAGQGSLIASWSTNSQPSTKVFTFNQSQLGSLNSYISGTTDTCVGFAIDPDCYYTNVGCEFKICYEQCPIVPAPAAILLGGIGTCLVGWLRKRRTL